MMARRARREAISYAQVLLEAPHQFHDFMEEIRDGQIEVGAFEHACRLRAFHVQPVVDGVHHALGQDA